MQSAAPEEKLVATPAATMAQRLSFPALIVGNLCLAFGPWMVRLTDVGPVAAGFWRLALAAPIMLLLIPVTGQRAGRITGGLWWLLAIAGICFALDLAAWHVGIRLTRLANATLFGNSTSFLFVAYGFLVARRWPGRNQSIALALAVAGVGLLLGRSFRLSPDHVLGDLFCLLAAVLYLGYLIAIDRARATLPPLPALGISTIVGAVLLLPLAFAFGETVMPGNWTPLILLALGSQLFGQGLIVYSIAYQPPTVVGLALLVQPVVAATIGWIAYGETLAAADLFGAAAVAAALVLVRRKD